MAFMIKEIIDLKGILFLVLLTIPSIATTSLDCHGKAFHCVNSTHFMICVDLGRGISTTIDDFIIPCPVTTICKPTNRFECEFPASSVLPQEISTIATTQTSESEVDTSNLLFSTTIPFEEYFNTLSTTTLSQSDQQSFTTDSVLSVDSSNVVNTMTNASKSDILITDASITKDTNVQPGSTIDKNHINSVKSIVSNSSNVENKFISNLNVVPYEMITVYHKQELTTAINILEPVTDSSALNTISENSQNGILSDISPITEQTLSTTQLFTKYVQEPLVNETNIVQEATNSPVLSTVPKNSETGTLPDISAVTEQTVSTSELFAEDFKQPLENENNIVQHVTDSAVLNNVPKNSHNGILSDISAITEKTVPSTDFFTKDVVEPLVNETNIVQEATYSPVLSTVPKRSETGTLPDISAVTEQTVSTSELFTKEVQEPLVNLTILDHAPKIIITAEPISELKHISNASKSEDNVNVDGTVILKTANTNSKNTTNFTSRNDVHLNDSKTLFITNTNQTSTPFEATTVINYVNQEQVNVNTNLGTHVTESFVLNTTKPTDIATTEATADSISNSTYYQKSLKSATTPAFISGIFATSTLEYDVTIEPTIEVEQIVNSIKSESNIITDTTTHLPSASKTTEAQVNIFSSNSEDLNVFHKSYVKVTVEPMTEVKLIINTTKPETNIITNSTASPIDENKTREAPVHILSNNSDNTNIYNNSKIEVTTESSKGVKEIVNAIKYETKIDHPIKLNHSSMESADKSIFSNNNNLNIATNAEINTNITYETSTATNIGNDQELLNTNVILGQPLPKPSVPSTTTNLENDTTIDIMPITTASYTEKILNRTEFPKPSKNITNIYGNSGITTNFMTVEEIATTTPNNDLETLTTSSSELIKLELTTENIINNLENDAESISEGLNHLPGNITDRMVLNEKVLFTNLEDNNASTQTYKSDSENKTETSTLVKIIEITTNQYLPSIPEETTVAVAENKDSALNVIEGSINKTFPRTENAAQSESVTSFTSLTLSSIAIDESDRSTVDNTNQINDNTYLNNDSTVTYTESLQTVTTKIQDSRSATDSHILKEEYIDQVILPDQNKVIVTAAEIRTLPPPAATADLNKDSYTKHIEIPQTNDFITETSASLSLTDIQSTVATYTTPEYIGTKETAGYPGKTIVYNINDEKSTTMDLLSQPTPSNTVFTMLDYATVVETTEKNSLSKSESDMLPDGNTDSTVTNRIITENQILLAATTTKNENITINNFMHKNAETVGPLNGTSNNLAERNIIITTETIYQKTPDTQATKLVTQSNVPIDRIGEKIDASTTSSHVKSSNGTDFVNTNQNILMISTRNKSAGNIEIQKSQSERPKPSTELDYDNAMTLTTITTHQLDNTKKVNASMSLSEISLSTDIGIGTISRSMVKDIPVEINISQDLRPSVTNQNLVSSEKTSKYSEADVQYTTKIPVMSHNDIIASKDNETTTQDFTPKSYLKPGTNPLQNYLLNSSSSAAKNVESVTSTAYTALNTQPVPSGVTNVEGSTATDSNLTVTKLSNVSLVENTESNVSNQELYVKLPNENKTILSDLYTHSQSLTTNNNLVTTAASTITDIPITGLNTETNIRNSFDTEIKMQSHISGTTQRGNMGTIQSSNDNIILTEAPYVSMINNEAKHGQYQQIKDVYSNLNDASNGFGSGSITKSTISGNKNLETATSNNDIKITKSLDTALVNEPSNTPNPEPPHVTSNSTTASITNNTQDIILVATTFKNDLIEESIGTTVVSITSSNPIEPVKYSLEKTITQADNTLTSVYSNNESQFVTKPVEVELPQTMASAAQTQKGSYQNNHTQLLEVSTIKSSVGNEKQTENLSITPQEIVTRNSVVRQPFVVTLPTDSDTSLMKSNATQNKKTVASSNITNQLPHGILTTSTIIGNKQESITPKASKSYQGPLKTSEDIISNITKTGLAINLIAKNLEITIEHSPVFIKGMNTDINVKVVGAVTPTGGLRTETWKEEANTEVDSVKNYGVRDNMEQTHSQEMFSANLPNLGGSEEVSSSSDVLIDNMESEKTHSGIISLITQLPSHSDSKEKKEKPEKEESEDEEISDEVILTNADKELVNLSAKYLSTPAITLSNKKNYKEVNNTSTREEMLIKTESYEFQSITDIDSVASTSMKINAEKNTDNGAKTAGSEIKKETPTHKLSEISTALTNDSHTSNNKSKDQNESTFDAHDTTVMYQSSTPRYMPQTKSAAVDDKQTESKSATLKRKLNKFSCTNKKRGRYADELDCRKFYICLGNSHVVEGTCPNNTVFSAIRKQCSTNLSHCIRNNQFRCTTKGHFSDFLNDNVYFICVKNNVSSFIRFKLMCQNGYHLNKTAVRCELSKKSNKSSSKSEVTNSDSSKNNSDQSVSSAKLEAKKKLKFRCKREGVFADRTDCRRYFECRKTDGTDAYRQKRKKCASDQIFHRDKKRCLDDDSYECN